MKGIIFDMDGTMVDNMMVHHRAWQAQFNSLGIEMTLEEVREKVHGINHEILKRLFGDRFSTEERNEISAAKEAAYRTLFLKELKLVDGLPDFLEECHANNIPMAIGSAAPPENVDFVIDHLAIRHFFQGIMHAKSVEQGKPNPEIFEKAAATMGLSAHDCLIFEDSVTGAETARRAGAPTIILTTTHAAEEFNAFSNVLRCISDFTKITVSEIMTSAF
ncbi:MAG: HAD family phosphatase [Saprospiraceae bacterium]|nr:HAD family phosphatase [Saprospiraceae bacterium]